MEQYSDQIRIITRAESASLKILITHTPNKSSSRPPKSKHKSSLPFMRTICFGLILHQGLKWKLLSLLVQSQAVALTLGALEPNCSTHLQGSDKGGFSLATTGGGLSFPKVPSASRSLWPRREEELWGLETLGSPSGKGELNRVAANSTLSSSLLPLVCLSHCHSYLISIISCSN